MMAMLNRVLRAGVSDAFWAFTMSAKWQPFQNNMQCQFHTSMLYKNSHHSWCHQGKNDRHNACWIHWYYDGCFSENGGCGLFVGHPWLGGCVFYLFREAASLRDCLVTWKERSCTTEVSLLMTQSAVSLEVVRLILQCALEWLQAAQLWHIKQQLLVYRSLIHKNGWCIYFVVFSWDVDGKKEKHFGCFVARRLYNFIFFLTLYMWTKLQPHLDKFL